MSVLSAGEHRRRDDRPRLEPADPVAVIATAVAGLSLAWRRTRPMVSFGVFTVGCLVVTLTDHYIGLLSILLLFSLYSLAAHGGRRQGVVGLVASIVVFNVLSLLDVPDLETSDLLQAFALLVVAWALGDAIRSRRAQQARAPAAGRAGGSCRTRTVRPRRHRGAAADRARAARRGRAQHVADRGAGRCGRARDPHRRGRRRARPRGDRRDQPQGADPDPLDARPAPRRGHRPRSRARADDRRPRRPGRRRRAGRDRGRPGRRRAAARRSTPVSS